MATHSSVLAWRIPGTAEPGGLPSMGSHRVRHDWSDLAVAVACKMYLPPIPCWYFWEFIFIFYFLYLENHVSLDFYLDGSLWASSVCRFSQLLSHAWLFVTPRTVACQALWSSTTPGACSNSCPLSQWCHPTISSSVVPFSSCLPSFPASGSFLMSQLFSSGGQSIGVSASTSVLPMNT